MEPEPSPARDGEALLRDIGLLVTIDRVDSRATSIAMAEVAMDGGRQRGTEHEDTGRACALLARWIGGSSCIRRGDADQLHEGRIANLAGELHTRRVRRIEAEQQESDHEHPPKQFHSAVRARPADSSVDPAPQGEDASSQPRPVRAASRLYRGRKGGIR